VNKRQKLERAERLTLKREQAEIVVRAIGRGASAKDALLGAGYSEATAAHHAKKVLKGRYVREAVERIGEAISNKSNSSLAKFRLQDLLLNPKADLRVLVQAIRMALEANAEIGQHANVFQQNNFISPPPIAASLMAGQLRKIREREIASGAVQRGDSSDSAMVLKIAEYEAIAGHQAERPPQGFQESATVEENAKDYV